MLAVSNSTFSGNSPPTNGGGIALVNGAATVSNSTFSGNAPLYGGGIRKIYGTLTLENTIVQYQTVGIASVRH